MDPPFLLQRLGGLAARPMPQVKALRRPDRTKASDTMSG
jgi:hypothetical protein